jgi:hypothetical protein
MEKKIVNGQTIQVSKPSLEDVNEALRWINDTLTWAQIPCFLIGDTAEKLWKQENLDVDKIEVGILKNWLTQDTVKLLRTFVPEIEFSDNIEISHREVPIVIKVINKKYKYFNNLDFLFYMADEYKIPNPMNEYLKARWLIK